MITEEDTRIENVDTGGSPPCEVIIPGTDKECGKPSCRRVHAACNACGERRFVFVCRLCDEACMNSGVICIFCRSDLIEIKPS